MQDPHELNTVINCSERDDGASHGKRLDVVAKIGTVSASVWVASKQLHVQRVVIEQQLESETLAFIDETESTGE